CPLLRCFFYVLRPPPRPTLFPYTTLFRSPRPDLSVCPGADRAVRSARRQGYRPKAVFPRRARHVRAAVKPCVVVDWIRAGVDSGNLRGRKASQPEAGSSQYFFAALFTAAMSAFCEDPWYLAVIASVSRPVSVMSAPMNRSLMNFLVRANVAEQSTSRIRCVSASISKAMKNSPYCVMIGLFDGAFASPVR